MFPRDALCLNSAGRLCAERAATPAGALDVRIIELKARALHGFYVVHLSTIQVQHARLVDENLEAVKTVSLIKEIRRILECHRIAESGATAPNHSDPEPSRPGILRVQDFPYLVNCRFGQLHHRTYNPS